MRIIKLYEQWVTEEETSVAQPVQPTQVAAPTQATPQLSTASTTAEVISVIPDGDEANKFTINAVRQPGSPSGIESTFIANSSTNAGVKKGATVMISKNPDSEGMFDVVASNDPNNVADSSVWSAKVNVA
jgi:ethanolamine utilization protein EutP (predicted NTPase)